MKKVVALALALVSMSAFAGTQSADYTTCKANAKDAFGADAVVKVKRFRGQTVEMFVTTKETGRFVAVCDRNSFAVSKK
jgi:hypothetical protein